MPSPSWSRSPEARATHLDRHMTAWVRWLVRCAMPTQHIAILLELDLAAVDDAVHRKRTKGPVPAIPTAPPSSTAGRGRQIRSQTARKVYQLRDLHYPHARIATILTLQPADVSDLLLRAVPIRRVALVRPRSRPEQARLRPPRPRREPPPEIPADEAWRYQGGPAPGDPPIAPELVVDQVVADSPSSPWEGPVTFQDHLGKLTSKQIQDGRAMLATGETYATVAKWFGVSMNTVRTHCGRKGTRPRTPPTPVKPEPVPPPVELPTTKARCRGGVVRWDLPLREEGRGPTVCVECDCGRKRNKPVADVLRRPRGFLGTCARCQAPALPC
jgi:hypothetical protein